MTKNYIDSFVFNIFFSHFSSIFETTKFFIFIAKFLVILSAISLNSFIVVSTLLFNGEVMKVPQTFAHHSALESIWTEIFAIVLVIIAISFFFLLYALERRDLEDSLILRIVGNQWFWSYEYETTKILENFGTVLALVEGFLAVVKKRSNFTTFFVSILNLIKKKNFYYLCLKYLLELC